MGLYGMSYPIYTMLLALSTAGIPVAISKLVSEKLTQGNYRGAHRVFRLSFFILAGTGLVFSTLLFFGARPLVERGYLADPRAYYAVISIAPAVFLVSVMSAFRGFFQGMQTMVPTAMSQLVEQVVRAATALALAYYLVGAGHRIMPPPGPPSGPWPGPLRAYVSSSSITPAAVLPSPAFPGSREGKRAAGRSPNGSSPWPFPFPWPAW